MRWFKQSSDKPALDWKPLTSQDQFLALLGGEDAFAVFKHSTRCSISFMARSRVEREWADSVPVYEVDVIQHRAVSNFIAEHLNIPHQSPQMIVISNGSVVYSASHNAILPEQALASLDNAEAR